MGSAFAKAQSVNTAYLCLANGDVVLADLSTCSSTVVATNNQSMFDIAEGDTADTLYGIRNQDLYLIDLNTGNFSLLGNLTILGYSGNFRVDSLVKEQNGILLGVNNEIGGELFRIDVSALTATGLGSTGFRSAGDLSFFQGDLYLSARNSELVNININNPPASFLVGSMASGGFSSVFGVVTIITANACATNPTIELVATGGRTTKFVNTANGATSNNCTNLTNSDIFGAAEVTSDIICPIDLEIFDDNQMTPDPTPYCIQANTLLNANPDPITPQNNYLYEWRVLGNPTIIATSSTLPLMINSTTTYECTVIDTGIAAPNNFAVDQITITVNPAPVWTPLAPVFAYQSYTLPSISGSNIPVNSAYYTGPRGAGMQFNPGDIVTEADFTSNPVTLFVYGDETNGCEVVGQFDLEFIDVQVTINPGGIQEICEGDTLTLTATPNPSMPIGTYTYNWTDSQNTVYPDTASITFTATVDTTLSVTVNDSGVENGTDMGFDMTDFIVLRPVDLAGLVNQNATSTYTFPSIFGTGLTGGERYYTQPNGMGTAYDPGDIVSPADFSSLPVQLYTYDNNGSCDDEQSFFLDFDIPVAPTLNVSSSTNIICAGETVLMTATAIPSTPTGSYTYEWREVGTTAVLSVTNQLSIAPTSSTSYECTVTDTGLTSNNTAAASITITVEAQPLIDPLVDQIAFGTFTFPVITGTDLTGAESYYTQPAGMGTSYNAGDTVTAASFTTLPVFIFIYDSNGNCNEQEGFLLDFDTPPPLSLTLRAQPQTICERENTTLTATPNPAIPQGSYTFEWIEQATGIFISNSDTVQVNPSVTSTYECTVTDTGISTGNTVTASIIITVETAPQLAPIADQSIFNSFTFPTIIGTNLSGNERYYTVPDGQGTSFNAGDNILFSDFDSYPITIYVYDVNAIGCQDQVSFNLTIEELELFIIPQYTTPNSDGFHDFWQIEVLHPDVLIENIFIFDRYGKLLKQLSIEGPGWDATYNNQPLPSSTYWYSFEYSFNGNRFEEKGFFAVKR
ncbi:gliding motility-associated-like protein [Nonlabens dokdonensis]|jgi:gliding motility-associated-like protein|nr:gliding motility-associated-like protein [Nonlabens dokdonensis]